VINIIINTLSKFGFTEIESKVYYELVKNPNSNGSQIAKILNLPRTSVYSALDKLLKKGSVFLLAENDSNKYIALEPNKLLKKLKKEYMEGIELLNEEFEKISINDENNQYININGEEIFFEKIAEMLKNAKEEIYINTNFDLNIFEKEFLALKKKNIRIIMFTFEDIDYSHLGIEVFSKKFTGKCRDDYKRMMLVVDMKEACIGEKGRNKELIGTFTKNRLLIDIVTEHIHHDIYLTNLSKYYDIDMNKIKINSNHEKLFS
jgi:sugar-specific transcriptional regulator TrmB